MEIAKQLGKYEYVNCPGVFRHDNPAYGRGLVKDAMFLKQQELGWSVDQKTYYERKNINFGL